MGSLSYIRSHHFLSPLIPKDWQFPGCALNLNCLCADAGFLFPCTHYSLGVNDLVICACGYALFFLKKSYADSIPGLRRSRGVGNGNSLQYSCWGIPWIEEPGGLQSMGSHRVGQDCAVWQQQRGKETFQCEYSNRIFFF